MEQPLVIREKEGEKTKGSEGFDCSEKEPARPEP